MSTYPRCPHLLECALTHGDELLVEVEGCGTVLLNGSHIPIQRRKNEMRSGGAEEQIWLVKQGFGSGDGLGRG